MALGNRLKTRMADAGLSQSELARRVGVTQGAISQLIKGDSQGSKHLHRIARELGTTAAYLAGDTDDPSPAANSSELAEDEAELIDMFRQLTADRQEIVKQVAANMIRPRTVHAPNIGYRAESV